MTKLLCAKCGCYVVTDKWLFLPLPPVVIWSEWDRSVSVCENCKTILMCNLYGVLDDPQGKSATDKGSVPATGS